MTISTDTCYAATYWVILTQGGLTDEQQNSFDEWIESDTQNVVVYDHVLDVFNQIASTLMVNPNARPEDLREYLRERLGDHHPQLIEDTEG